MTLVFMMALPAVIRLERRCLNSGDEKVAATNAIAIPILVPFANPSRPNVHIAFSRETP
jgi:hypothetical protein